MLILDYVNDKVLHFGSFSASTSTHILSLPCPNHRVAAQKVVSFIQIDARILKVPPFSIALNIWGHFSLLPVWYFFKHVGKTNTGFIHIKITYYPWQTVSDVYQAGSRSNFPTFPPAPGFPASSTQVTAAQMRPVQLLSGPKHRTRANQVTPSSWHRLSSSCHFSSSSSESQGSGLPAHGLLHS